MALPRSCCSPAPLARSSPRDGGHERSLGYVAGDSLMSTVGLPCYPLPTLRAIREAAMASLEGGVRPPQGRVMRPRRTGVRTRGAPRPRTKRGPAPRAATIRPWQRTQRQAQDAPASGPVPWAVAPRPIGPPSSGTGPEICTPPQNEGERGSATLLQQPSTAGPESPRDGGDGRSPEYVAAVSLMSTVALPRSLLPKDLALSTISVSALRGRVLPPSGLIMRKGREWGGEAARGTATR